MAGPSLPLSTLSNRGRSALSPPPAYILLSFSARTDKYHPETNPTGFVDLSVAENRLSLPLVAEALSRARSSSAIPNDELVYGDYSGRARLKSALASLFSRHLLKVPVEASEIAVSAGAGSVLDLLATVLCDAGDKVMVTAPGYSGFSNDVRARAGCVLAVAHLEREGGFRVNAEVLEKCWVEAGGEDSGIKFVVLSSPNNPTGEVLGAGVVKEIVEWAMGKDGLHLVMDEIYGMSVFDEDGEGFVSVASVLEGKLTDRIHLVWSFSKDLCLSGERVGVLYSRNIAVLGCFQALTYFSSPAATAQHELALILEDKAFLESYIVENKRRLRTAYQYSIEALRELGIPFELSRAGFFVLFDLRRWLVGEDLATAEVVLFDRLCDQKLLLSPAGQMLSHEYGWFRCCFAAVEPPALEEAWKRLALVLGSIHKSVG